jgi:hypothetical protein
VTLSGSPDRTASRTAEAVPSRGEEAPFFLDMFCIVTEFLLTLDGNFDQGSCLSHVGTEGLDAGWQVLVDTLRAATATGLSEVKLRDTPHFWWFNAASRVNAFLRGDLTVAHAWDDREGGPKLADGAVTLQGRVIDLSTRTGWTTDRDGPFSVIAIDRFGDHDRLVSAIAIE